MTFGLLWHRCAGRCLGTSLFQKHVGTHALLMEWIGEESSLFFSLDFIFSLYSTVNTMAGFYKVFFYVNCYRFSSYREQDCIGALIFHLTFGIHRLLTFPAPSLDYSRRKFKMKKKEKASTLLFFRSQYHEWPSSLSIF